MDRVIQKFVIVTLASFLLVGMGYSFLNRDSSTPKIQAFESIQPSR
jgi:hypothetical protein